MKQYETVIGLKIPLVDFLVCLKNLYFNKGLKNFIL